MAKIKKVINDPADIVEQTLDGITLLARGDIIHDRADHVLRRRDRPAGKVGLVIGGGSGHEPMYSAFVGPGYADASVAGEIFAAPGPDAIMAAARAANGGKGVLFVYGNYAGDIMNFDMASELLADEGIEVRTVLVADDVAVADRSARRGIAGAFYQVKVAGYACATCDTLAAAAELVEHAKANIASLGVALRPGSLPNTGQPTFSIGEDEMEIGMGVHGERGVERRAMMQADPLVAEMIQLLIADLGLSRGERIAMFVNNLGATTLTELMIVLRAAQARCLDASLTVERIDVGAHFTSQEMAGFSITLMRLDDTLAEALAYPAASPFHMETGG